MEILSLKWNNHQIVFSQQMNELRKKTSYTDTTLVCHGKFYHAHKLVLSTCSDYFQSIFNHITCNNPVIVLKDISCQDLEFLLDYMYIGEVNVKKNELNSLISAAENLQVKGLAVPDENVSHPSGRITKSVDQTCQETNGECNFTQGNEDHIKEKADRPSESQSKEYFKTKDKGYPNIDSQYLSPNNVESTFIQNNFPGPYVSDIKSDPELIVSNVNNDLKVEPCSSNNEEPACPDYSSQTKFNFFSSDAEFTEDLSQNDDLSLSSSLDSQNSLPHGPYLQLPYAAYIRRDSTTLRDKSGRDTLKRDYACSYCGRIFSHRTNQLAHERIHTGEKPFRCLYCNFRTALKGNLKNHIFSRHQADWKSIKHLIFPSKDN